VRQQRAWLFGILLLAVIGSVFLLVFFRGWIREAVVLPVAYLFWILGLLLRSIDQAVYWGILIVFGFIVTFYVLWPEPVKGDPEKPVERGRIHSRYYQWFSYYHHLDESSFAGDSLARELVRLTVQILSYQQNVSPDEI